MITFAEDDPPPPPGPSVPADPLPLPGTPAWQARLRERALTGQPLFQPGDVLHAPDQLAHKRRLRNGHDKIDQGVPVVKKRAEVGEKPSMVVDRNRGRRISLALLARPELASFGQRLRDLRRARGQSLEQVAYRAGITRQCLHHLETGRNVSPTLAVLWGIADAFGLTLDELVGRR